MLNKSEESLASIPKVSPQPTMTVPESFEVKVEITPPTNQEGGYIYSSIPQSGSLESTSSSYNLSLNHSDSVQQKSMPSTSPQQRKMSEFSQDGLLNPANFNRLNPTTGGGGGTSSRLFKKIEEMMDLSSPYNHYRCLSPSESNLLQCSGNILNMSAAFQNLAGFGGNLNVPSPNLTNQFLTQQSQDTKLKPLNSPQENNSNNKPGSGRLLRRQFSLDKEDLNNSNNATNNISNNLGKSSCLQSGKAVNDTSLQPHSSLPSITGQVLANKQVSRNLHKQNSSSISQDLEKIEEIPLSPNHPMPSTSSHQHYSYKLSHVPNLNSSLSNSIPFIDSSSCSSSVSTIPSSSAAQVVPLPPIPSNNSSNNNSPGQSTDRREINLNVESLILR